MLESQKLVGSATRAVAAPMRTTTISNNIIN